MAKRIIKSKHGRGYGLVEEDGSVTPISLDESTLVESKRGRGFGLNTGGQVIPVDLTGLQPEDIGTLKKKEDTVLSGKTSSTVGKSNLSDKDLSDAILDGFDFLIISGILI